MPETSKRPWPQDRIHTGNPAHIKYWAEHLRVSRQALRRAIDQAGPELADVRRYLNR